MEIKYIIFDFGGVLLTEDDNWLYSDDVKSFLKVDDTKLTEAWNAAWPGGRNGTYDENQFFTRFLEVAVGEVKTENIFKLKHIYRKYVAKNEIYNILPKLTGKYHLYALTNITKDWLDFKIRHFNLMQYIEVIISSCHEGIGKPDKEIYEALIKKTNLKPNEALFIDNSEYNLTPAREIGINTIFFENFDQTVSDMRKLGINI